MTGLFVRAATRLGYKVFVHHHAYMYIDKFDEKMARIDRSMGAGHVHLMHCQKMIDDFRRQYSSHSQCEYMFPSFASLPPGEARREVPKPFRLGFLANLTLAKGLDLVLNTFRALRERKSDVRLCLAGPCATADAQRLVSDALKEFGETLTYIGPVFDERKIEFFNSIDGFLFPSRTEAWPIVLNEALDAGVPVIATNRGCVRTMVGDRAGLIVENADNYVADATRQVETWMDSPETYLVTSKAAIEQASVLRRQATMQLERVISRICSSAEWKPI
jgi:glycosyltransferase involved in cell wall biosynthesis